MAVVFPKIERLSIYGFGKIFTSNDFQIDLSGNLNILLGGNGLGKTTLLQCLVYALTGGTDEPEVEEIRSQRWNHNYFKGRINDDAFVLVDFLFGQNFIRVKRGFTSTRVLECTVSTYGQDDFKAITIEQAVIEYGNYDSVSDFSFIVNRLLYLPENRRSLLWDYDAQIRALMIINNELVVEKEYRALRQLVKEKDSNKRKIHWDIGRIEKRAALQKTPKPEDSAESSPSNAHNLYIKKKKDLLGRLQDLSDNSQRIYSLIKSNEETRAILARTISEIGDQIRKTESDYVQALLLEHDEKNALVFNKTLKTGHCPACDQKSDSLKVLIQERVKSGVCLICGEPISNHKNSFTYADLDTLNSQLSEKIAARNELDVQIIQNKNKLSQIEEDISAIRNQLSKLDYDYSDDFLAAEEDADNVDFIDEELITEEYVNLCQKEKELEAEINQLTKKADEIYDTFISSFQSRYEQLYQIYSDLASKFIGVPVELTYTKSKAKFVNMSYLVPRFYDVDRDAPETCSEAQRFFLDIAFRMSVITLSKGISKTNASFICETPENALDVSYVDNVVKMFLSFMQKGGNLVLTNNLQYLGIAQSLVQKAKGHDVRIEVFDLLKYGRLSDIQTASTQLTEIRDAILAEVEQ
ncbi:hypothetical protein Psfp_03991 [Pelotomaculum sp. FP]|uniref:ATP-binding protein n=1 Tax=Pelotomaculum sp. FP TaxID=261474 RepID=UPI001065646C|nr:AAA family ATPase [Pelotomaculum sp. FP]TEB11293.1 hypothetical protein Psfp_03991 [Pelotomaculum sp. FP]